MPAAPMTVWLMAFDEELVDLQSSQLDFGEVTGVTECGGKLYCGTVAPHQRALLEVDLPYVPLAASARTDS